jgi:hypothetical protein
LIETELAGNDLQRFAVGESNVAAGESLPKRLGHEFGVAKIAHIYSFRWRQQDDQCPRLLTRSPSIAKRQGM